MFGRPNTRRIRSSFGGADGASAAVDEWAAASWLAERFALARCWTMDGYACSTSVPFPGDDSAAPALDEVLCVLDCFPEWSSISKAFCQDITLAANNVSPRSDISQRLSYERERLDIPVSFDGAPMVSSDPHGCSMFAPSRLHLVSIWNIPVDCRSHRGEIHTYRVRSIHS